MHFDRRRLERTPVGFYMQQYIHEEPHRCFITDLSPLGLFAERPFVSFRRRSAISQLELPLPGTGETVWVRGEVVYDRFDSFFHGSAFRFTDMARQHQRLLHDWLRESAREPFGLPLRPDASRVLRILRPRSETYC